MSAFVKGEVLKAPFAVVLRQTWFWAATFTILGKVRLPCIKSICHVRKAWSFGSISAEHVSESQMDKSKRRS